MNIDFHAVFERSPNAYMLLDRELRYVAANAAYLHITASRLEDLLGKRILDAFPHDPDEPENQNARHLRESFERVLATREVDVVALLVYRVPRHEGDRIVEAERWWSATHTPLLDANGDVELILQHTVDVTALHRHEQTARAPESPRLSASLAAEVLGLAQRVQETNWSLDAERRHLLRLFEQAPGFTCFLRGPEHVFTLANHAYYQLVGHREILEMPVRKALPELVGQGYYELLDGAFATGQPFVGRGLRLLIQRLPGTSLEEIFVDFVYQPIVDPSGIVTGIFVQGNDITVQKRLESERGALLEREQTARADAERANHVKDDLLATVSHELRTPLNAMLGWVLLLRGGPVSNEQREQALEAVERNARTQAQVIDDLLDASLMFSGKLELQRANVAVAEVVTAGFEAVRAAADTKGITLDGVLASDVTVVGDRARLQQIVWNLLANAVKFTPKHGCVEARVERRGDTVEVTVSDTGTGIPIDFLPHVFERFRQADAGTTRAHGGLGLGLAIVRHLVERHGGTVTAENRSEGAGAKFTVRLPVAPVATATPVTTAPPPPAPPDAGPGAALRPFAGLRLLVVDDEPDARDLVRALLTKDGAEVETASSAAEGFAAFRRRTPDLLISDIGMPVEDGYGLIRRIRALPPEEGGRVPAVALTAFTQAVDRMRALRAGFKAHVPKPIAPAELRAVLTTLVAPNDRDRRDAR